MTEANDLLRFALEVAGVVAAAYWGFHTSSNAVAGVVVALVAAAAFVVAWALVVAPGADNPISPTIRELIGSALLLLTAAGVYMVGRQRPAIIFVGLILLNTALMLVLDG